MANEELLNLKNEADALGISYSANIGAKTLQGKIDEFYKNESKSADIAVEVVEEEVPEKETKVVKPGIEKVDGSVDLIEDAAAVIAKQKKANNETVVVKIAMVDKREASTATSAYFSNGNVGMRVPLDTFVEMPKILVRQAEKAQALAHQKIDGISGSVPKLTKKYVIEYKR